MVTNITAFLFHRKVQSVLNFVQQVDIVRGLGAVFSHGNIFGLLCLFVTNDPVTN